ncbi:MAG: dihydroorotase [Saprospiraceae bacterium]|nr:dihydroorotase [Lewinellaceae bacterium]MBP6809967.1 dihydroorotase [Saprospiraceae bacterium]
MQVLLKNAHLFDGISKSRVQDILLKDGLIEAIGDQIPLPQGAALWESSNLCVSPGWLDVGVYAADPGFEHREDLTSAAAAAVAGGFTAMACFPNTDPALHTKSEILYVKNKANDLPVYCYPIGAVSQSCEGKDLAELFDMHAAGAVAFSDGKRSVQDAGLLLRALQYAKAFDGLIINVPHHKTIAAGGQMHEGLMSTSLGLKGLPALAEELMVQRDLSLLEYSEGRLHIHLISTAKSVALVRAAKQAGLQVSCSVAVANLCFSEEKLAEFDSNWKIVPPLRNKADADALLEGLADGTIDFICSNHSPWHEEAKNLEFTYAEFGMIGLETVFSLCRTFLDKKLTVNDLVEKLSLAPRRVLGLPIPKITKGERAELTVFDPELEWVLEAKDIRSKSSNTPFIGQKFKGKVLGVFSGK